MDNGPINQKYDLETSGAEVVRAFYSGFTGGCDFADENWNHRKPIGG
jgi:hypothetical protein